MNTTSRQTRHALTALARTTPGRRNLIAARAAKYVAQIDRRILPLGHDAPIGNDRLNRIDAYRMRGGDQVARMLGIACRPEDTSLPNTARAVLDAVDATPRRLAALAHATGHPHLVAALHVAGVTA